MENLNLNNNDEIKLYLNKRLFKDNLIFSEYEFKKILDIIYDMICLCLHKKDINPYDIGIYIEMKRILVDFDEKFIHKEEFKELDISNIGFNLIKEVRELLK